MITICQTIQESLEMLYFYRLSMATWSGFNAELLSLLMKLNHLVVLAVCSLNYFSFQSTFAEETTQVPKVSNEKKKHKFTNRLINEKSPYLLQHAHNPVDWYPWGEEAFEVAKKTQKPILLSVGYSTCHWCHVMERESFEDEEIAKIMNEHFVCVKLPYNANFRGRGRGAGFRIWPCRIY